MAETRIPRRWRIMVCAALILAAASIALSAFLFSNLRDVSRQGCERQNELRRELNATLRSFHQRPRFNRTDCHKVYSLRLPF